MLMSNQVQHFKTNIRDIRSGYPAIHKWLKNLYWNHPAFGETTDFEHIKRHYTRSHPQINPHAITPLGPEPDILPSDQEVNAVKGAKSVDDSHYHDISKHGGDEGVGAEHHASR